MTNPGHGPPIQVALEDVAQLIKEQPQIKIMLENVVLRRLLAEKTNGRSEESVPEKDKQE